MDIHDLFDGIMKSIKQFSDVIAQQRIQEKMQETGRGPGDGGKNPACQGVVRNACETDAASEMPHGEGTPGMGLEIFFEFSGFFT